MENQGARELNKDQEKAVNHGSGPLLIVAGAGSGKTKTLTTRLARLIESGVPPERVIAITFTNKAAKEMKNRVGLPDHRSGGPFVGTFHSLGARILKEEAARVGRTAAFSIFDEDDSLSAVKTALKELGYDDERPAVVRRAISDLKNELRDATAAERAVIAETFEKYESLLRSGNAFDFDDLIEKTVAILKNHPEALARHRARFDHILVDEFQDVNAAQYELVRLLAGSHRNLSVVGDDAQSIYSFRGSDFRNFLNFERDWPEATVVTLDRNYRSTPVILDAASAVIANNTVQKPKKLWTETKGGETIWIVEAPTREDEAEFIAETVRGLTETHPTIAVLYRTNAQSRSIEQALISAGVEYRVFGSVRFYDRKEVRDVIAALRFVKNPADFASVERLEKALTKRVFRTVAPTLRAAEGKTILELIGVFLHAADYFSLLEKKYLDARDRKENVNELIVFASEFNDLGEFLERVALLESGDAPKKSGNAEPVVNLMTIHLAKGLEFDTVFVAGAAEGVLPHERSYGALHDLEEERRLMYVAMTRAKKRLFISYSRLPSRFLYEIPAEYRRFIDLSGRRDDLPTDEEMWIE